MIDKVDADRMVVLIGNVMEEHARASRSLKAAEQALNLIHSNAAKLTQLLEQLQDDMVPRSAEHRDTLPGLPEETARRKMSRVVGDIARRLMYKGYPAEHVAKHLGVAEVHMADARAGWWSEDVPFGPYSAVSPALKKAARTAFIREQITVKTEHVKPNKLDWVKPAVGDFSEGLANLADDDD
jgi:hypothetical protein